MSELPEIYWCICFGVLGLLLGSFGNVLIRRVPLGISVVTPRSYCPGCEKPIGWRDNIPVLSWLLLRGKCRACGVKISWRYPLVELLTAAFFVGAYLYLGWSWFLLEALIFLFGLVVVSFIDFDHFLLPDVFTLPGIVIGFAGAVLNPERLWWDSLLGIILGGGFLWCVAYLYYLMRKEDGLGGGDIKLMAWIGAVLGWNSVAFTIIVASVTGSIVGLCFAARGTKGMKTVIPFGPYLALGAVFYLFGGEELAHRHLEVFLPFLAP